MLKYYSLLLGLVLGMAGVGVRSLPLLPTTPAQPLSHQPTTPARSQRHATTHLSSLEVIMEESEQVYNDCDDLTDHTPEVHLSKPVPPNYKPVPSDSKPVPPDSKLVPPDSKPVPPDSKPVPSDSKPVPPDSKPVPRHPRPDLPHSTPTDAIQTHPHDHKTHATTPDGTLVMVLHRRRRSLYDYPANRRKRGITSKGAAFGKRLGRMFKKKLSRRQSYVKRPIGEGGYRMRGRSGRGGPFAARKVLVYTNHSPKTISFAHAKASGVARVSKIVG